ncbi:hypothetical protein BWQ58_05730 [Campylobacter jejuni]|nr:hypothetical protein [Campylobacter jejuni]
MTLNELKDGQKAIIVNLNAHKELKNRLFKNKNLKKIHSSLKNATIMVELDTSCVILRSDEAKTIEVNLI